ncbi:hypothetical protein AB3N60_15500 [Leptospira sp. WS39.C2]
MNKYNFIISILVFYLCTCKVTSLKSENPEKIHESIVSELEKKSYYVKVNTHKGIKTYVTIYPITIVSENDLINICKLPNLRNLQINNANLPLNYFDHLERCDLRNLSLFSLDSVPWKDGIICNLSANINTLDYLHLTNTNISDHDLKCISKFQFFKNLSFEGPAQKFSEEAFCNLMRSEIKINALDLYNLTLTPKMFECLLDIKGIKTFGFKKIKGRTASDMKKLEDLYFKKNGRKVTVDVFEYDSP